MFEKLKQLLRPNYVRLLVEEIERERAEKERLRAAFATAALAGCWI